MSVPFKVNAHLLAFVSVQFHPIFDRPRLNSGNCALYITSQTSRYRWAIVVSSTYFQVRVVKVRSHWGPRDLFCHIITEEEFICTNLDNNKVGKVLYKIRRAVL